MRHADVGCDGVEVQVSTGAPQQIYMQLYAILDARRSQVCLPSTHATS